DFGGADHLRNVEVALAAARRTDAHGFIGKTHVEGVAVGLRVHGHRGNTQLLARANHSQGDFPAVSDQDFLEHREGAAYFLRLGRMPNSGCPYSTGCPFSTKMRSTS